ncbi:bidirectional sugar transporter SWEET6b-like [Salvia miltiorrhiza]|uniref:bidirectional sugar transporter SWEET6b-like n=1 Tax=Salvia miltiorrhiza TaxID=226208 RepID=UPI0025AD0910|nr:bidirectional sugar transporter SWEET6b-like [Salvia miltiorrhiza]
MHGVSLIRFVVGVIGNIVSAFLFLSPMPTFWRIYKNKNTEDFDSFPYLSAFMNCIMWIFYGMPFVHPDSVLIITINSFGLLLEIIYLITFFIYTSSKQRKRIILGILLELVLFAIIIVVTLLALHTTTRRSMIVGILCDIFGILMYASPLSTMRLVIQQKNPESMPFWLCVTGFLNGAIWFCYAFLKKFDPYLAFGNGVGGAFGALQLSVYAYYYFKNSPSKDEVKPAAPAIELV